MAVLGGRLLVKDSSPLSSSFSTCNATATATLEHRHRRPPLLALHQYLLLPKQPIPYHSIPNSGRTRTRRCTGNLSSAATVVAATPSSFPVISNPHRSYIHPCNPSTRDAKKKITGFCTSTDSTITTAAAAAAAQQDEEDNDDKIKEAANTLDIRVGKILIAYKHPEADSLFVEEVDVGEPQPRIICSGLVDYIPLNDLMLLKVVVHTNLKPRNMRGVRSFGMLLAASDANHENVELLMPPENSVPGERIWFGSAVEKDSLPDVASPNQIQKKKIWELVQPHLKTDDSGVAALGLHTMRTEGGVVAARSLKNARIS